MNPYLTSQLPLIDVLVLDEADRMIEDGHFKELKLILEYVYTKRVEYKQHALNKDKVLAPEEMDKKQLYKEHVISLNRSKKDKKDIILKDIEKSHAKVDLS